MGRPTKEQQAAKAAEQNNTGAPTPVNQEGIAEKELAAQEAAGMHPVNAESVTAPIPEEGGHAIPWQNAGTGLSELPLPPTEEEIRISEGSGQSMTAVPANPDGSENELKEEPLRIYNHVFTDLGYQDAIDLMAKHGIISKGQDGDYDIEVDKDQFSRFLGSFNGETREYGVTYQQALESHREAWERDIKKHSGEHESFLAEAKSAGVDTNSLESAYSGLAVKLESAKEGNSYDGQELNAYFDTYFEVKDAVKKEIENKPVQPKSTRKSPVYHGDFLNQEQIDNEVPVTYNWEEVTAPEHQEFKPKG